MNLNESEIEKLFSDFSNLNVLIIGDVMIDAYYWGKVNRISPEAPVPIVSVEKKEARMGGAANVALNIQAMGATPILCAIIGKDDEGEEFKKLLSDCGQSKEGIVAFSNRTTTKKTRIIGNNYQMLRVDAEDISPLSKEESNIFYLEIEKIISERNIDAIIFEDYDKGAISKELIKKVVALAKKKGIPTTVDPKKVNFKHYQEVDLFKPNLKELKEGLKIEFDAQDKSALKSAIEELEKVLNNTTTLITLSEDGVYIHHENKGHHIMAHRRKIVDVSGAGDTVIAVATLCLAQKQSPKTIAQISNLAGGLVCENVGVVPIDKDRLLEEAKKLIN